MQTTVAFQSPYAHHIIVRQGTRPGDTWSQTSNRRLLSGIAFPSYKAVRWWSRATTLVEDPFVVCPIPYYWLLAGVEIHRVRYDLIIYI